MSQTTVYSKVQNKQTTTIQFLYHNLIIYCKLLKVCIYVHAKIHYAATLLFISDILSNICNYNFKVV